MWIFGILNIFRISQVTHHNNFLLVIGQNYNMLMGTEDINKEINISNSKGNEYPRKTITELENK